MRPPLIPGHGEREILGFLRCDLNLPLGKFRQDQLSKGAVQPRLIPVYSPALDLLFRIGRRHTKIGFESFVSNRPLT
ncbi:MAG: hypothetical protein EWM73_00323 [Nitrospira sp.]|nr:MAG: hypothetical protein EWM73_00323 [Nitrospira sp.]